MSTPASTPAGRRHSPTPGGPTTVRPWHGRAAGGQIPRIVGGERPDLVVIGAGATGLAAARSAAAAGRRVILVEAERPGGDCTFYGCVPSKTLIEVARRVAGVRRAPGVAATVTVDLPAVLRHVRTMVGEIAEDESPAVLKAEGIHLVTARARFTGPRSLELDSGDRLDADSIIIATGAGPAVPAVPGLVGVPYLTNRTVFDLDTTPTHLVVLGGGPIGVEIAQAFCRLRVPVSLVQGPARLVPKEEPEASEVLRAVLEREGVRVRTAARAVAATTAGGGVTLTLSDGTRVSGSHLLVAAGRHPNTAGLGLEAAGIKTDDAGRIAVDAAQRTTAPGVFAAGDVASPLQFTHVGDEMGRLAAANAAARRPRPFDDRAIPRVTFTEPEIGQVGLTEADAYVRYGDRAKVSIVWLAEVDRARTAGKTDGFVKLVAAPPARGLSNKYLLRLVGMTAVAPVGGEMVAAAGIAIRARMFAGRIAQAIHAYPTWSVATRVAAARFFGPYGGEPARPARPQP